MLHVKFLKLTLWFILRLVCQQWFWSWRLLKQWSTANMKTLLGSAQQPAVGGWLRYCQWKKFLPPPWNLQNSPNSGINYLLPTCTLFIYIYTVAGAWCLPSTVPSKLHVWFFFWQYWTPEEQPWLCYTSMIPVLKCEVLLDSWPLRQVMKQIYDVVKHNSLESSFLFNLNRESIL